MNNWVVFGGAVLYVIVGYLLGAYFGRRGRPATADSEPVVAEHDAEQVVIDPEQAREFLSRLRELTATVDSDVGRHNSRIEKISGELSDYAGTDATVVVAAAAQLIEANQQLQEDLVSAKAELQLQQEQLESYMREARTDGLTGVANRRAFDQELERRFAHWQRQGVPFCVTLVDVDHFKKFNDEYGHQVGDEVLQGVAHVLANTSRDMDLVARYGGEEFAIIMPGTTLEGASRVSSRVVKAISEHTFESGGGEFHITASAGASEIQSTGGAEGVVKSADAALYAAKAAGRNRGYVHDGKECLSLDEFLARERKAGRRKLQRIAPYVDGKFPERGLFCEIECQDLKPTGFSYFLDEEPEYEMLVMAIGSGAQAKYMTAVVKDCVQVTWDAHPLYRVTCEFTSRAELDFTSDEPEMVEA